MFAPKCITHAAKKMTNHRYVYDAYAYTFMNVLSFVNVIYKPKQLPYLYIHITQGTPRH